MSELSAPHLTNEARRYGVPEHCIGGLVAYIVQGRPVGDFLTALLSNDLMGALRRADDVNMYALHAYGRFLHNAAPYSCYGSADAVAKWLKMHSEKRKELSENGS